MSYSGFPSWLQRRSYAQVGREQYNRWQLFSWWPYGRSRLRVSIVRLSERRKFHRRDCKWALNYNGNIWNCRVSFILTCVQRFRRTTRGRCISIHLYRSDQVKEALATFSGPTFGLTPAIVETSRLVCSSFNTYKFIRCLIHNMIFNIICWMIHVTSFFCERKKSVVICGWSLRSPVSCCKNVLY